VPQSVHSSNSMTTSTMPINILPAQNNMICSNGVYLMASDTSAYLGGNKRGLSPSIAPTTMVLNNNNKRPKLEVMMANPIPNMVMQNAHPSLTQLPPSMEVVHDTRAVSTPKKANNKNGINTSTNHIKALTGVNGAAVCLEAIETALQQASKTSKSSDASCTVVSSLTTDSCSTDAHLSGEEKVKQSRDRNRQHARNTRVRKKAYVEELKRTLNTLAEERDVVLQQKRLEQQGIMDQRDVRFRVVEDFLNLRGRNEADPMRWSIILEDGFTLRLPRADIPGVVCSSGGPADTTNVPSGNGMCQSYPLGTNKKVLIGVQAIMEDSRMVLSLLQSLGASSLSVSYKCDRDSFMMDNASVVLNWEATSCGAVTKVRVSQYVSCLECSLWLLPFS